MSAISSSSGGRHTFDSPNLLAGDMFKLSFRNPISEKENTPGAGAVCGAKSVDGTFYHVFQSSNDLYAGVLQSCKRSVACGVLVVRPHETCNGGLRGTRSWVADIRT